VRWERPSRPYQLAMLVAVIVAVLFILNDWRVTAQRKPTRGSTSKPAAAMAR
jgi:hypothetical protein